MRGYTLLELLIAFSLSMGIVLALFSLYHRQHRIFERMMDQVHGMDAALTAIHLMSSHIRMAGFSSPIYRQHAQYSAGIFGCTGGYPSGVMTATGTCRPSAGRLRSDGVEVRYWADTISSWENANGQPSDCLGQALRVNDGQGPKSGFSVNRFFVRKSPTTGKPELYCEGSGRQGNPQPLVEGIEYFRIRYRLVKISEWVDAAAISAANLWNAVRAVELCVIARGGQQETLSSGAYIDCDGAQHTPTDAVPRYTVKTQVALRNPGDAMMP